MSMLLTGIAIGLVAAAAAVAGYRLAGGRRGRESRPAVTVHASIEEIRSIGELSVFKILTREIVTATDHSFGVWGKKYLEWMLSSRKMAMIFGFDIDFRYDLQSPDFRIEDLGGGKFRLSMPKCFYETHIKDINFYDEQNSKLLPWLLPDLLNRAFGAGFSEDKKNALIEEAKQQASTQARQLVRKMRSDVQNSARRTVEALAQGFGAGRVTIDFKDSELVQVKVEYDEPGDRQPAAEAA